MPCITMKCHMALFSTVSLSPAAIWTVARSQCENRTNSPDYVCMCWAFVVVVEYIIFKLFSLMCMAAYRCTHKSIVKFSPLFTVLHYFIDKQVNPTISICSKCNETLIFTRLVNGEYHKLIDRSAKQWISCTHYRSKFQIVVKSKWSIQSYSNYLIRVSFRLRRQRCELSTHACIHWGNKRAAMSNRIACSCKYLMRCTV